MAAGDSVQITKQRIIDILQIKDIDKQTYEKALKDIDYVFDTRFRGRRPASDMKLVHLSADICRGFFWKETQCGCSFWSKIFYTSACPVYIEYENNKTKSD